MSDPAPTAEALEDQAIELLVQLHSGRASAADQLAFTVWRQRSTAHAQAADAAEQLWRDLPHTATAAAFQLPPVARRRAGRRLAVSAALAASLAVVIIGGGLFGPVAALYADHATGVGERRELRLADGSQIWLNTSTVLSVEYSAGRRDIRLYQGEALFQVTKDAQRPFVVRAAGGSVRAVGTRFDVDLRGKRVGVAVSSGVVEVDSASRPTRLIAGEQLDYLAGQPPGAVRALDLPSASAWQRGKLIFNRRPLGEVLDELERYLPGRLLLTDDTLRGLLVSGVFSLDDPAALLRTLELTQPLRITRLPLLTLVRPL